MGEFSPVEKHRDYLSVLVSTSASGILSCAPGGGAGVYPSDTSFGAMRLES